MCCIVELAMTIVGIVILVKGKLVLSQSRVLTGGPAYLVGGILTATLPGLFLVGVVIGIAAAANAQAQGGGMPDMSKFAFLDLVIVPIILLIVGVLALAYSKPPEPAAGQPVPMGPAPTFPPMDPNNPYASPFAGQEPPPSPPPPDQNPQSPFQT